MGLAFLTGFVGSLGAAQHRLGKFAESYPEIDLRFSATMHHVDFARKDVDIAVRHGKGEWHGLHVERLCAEQLFPVCSPRFAEGGRFAQPSDIMKFPLLHLDARKDWSMWLDSAGVPGADVSRGPIMNRASMLIDAAIDGQGIALARTVLVRLGPDPRPAYAPVRPKLAVVSDILDCLPQGDGDAAKNQDIS